MCVGHVYAYDSHLGQGVEEGVEAGEGGLAQGQAVVHLWGVRFVVDVMGVSDESTRLTSIHLDTNIHTEHAETGTHCVGEGPKTYTHI